MLSLDPTRSLANMHGGETMIVRHIFFDTIRARCADVGIAEGDWLVCRTATPETVQVETPRGTIVNVDRGWGSFIQVGPDD